MPRTLYAPPAGRNVAQIIAVSYIDANGTREERWASECVSDAPAEHKRRVSHDNGRTWSAFEDNEATVNVQREDGGIVTSLGTGHVDPHRGVLYQILLRRLWPGMELYRSFRGREPSIQALLEARGLVGT